MALMWPGRAADRLGDHPAAGVEQAAGQVLALADDGREGGPHQRVLLLGGHRQQTIPDDFQGDGINRGVVSHES
jgi:hypothetical protein